MGDKAEIEDKEVEVKQRELKIDDQEEELRDDNNLNRAAINELRIQLTTLYDKPTASRKENFDEVVNEIFERYTELTNKRTSDQQRKQFEGLTIKADNALTDEIKRQDRINEIERKLKEQYEIAEEDRQPTFNMVTDSLWARYNELVDKERISSLREECENLTLAANEIDRLMLEEETKERIKQIQAELTRLYSQTRTSRKLDFEFIVDNLFGELLRLEEVNDTPEFRRPYEEITEKIENQAIEEKERKENEITETKTNLRNQYLIFKRNRRQSFELTTGFIFSKLVALVGNQRADEYINRLGIEFMVIARKPTRERRAADDDRKQEIIRNLMNVVPGIELNKMIEEGIKVEKRVRDREQLAQAQRL